MRRAKTSSFICELPLVLAGDDAHTLRIRFDVARQAYNACLDEALRRLELLRQSKAYQAARKAPRGKKRTAAFRAANEQSGFREYDLHAWATEHISHTWLSEHLDASTVQKLATRAFQAVQQYAVGKRGRPRFKSAHQFDSVEGKTNTSGIRFKEGWVEWKGLRLRAILDPDDAVIAHGLRSRIKYVRIVRRRLNGKERYFAQLICEGSPYRKSQHTLGQGSIGIDPGPRVFGLAGQGAEGETWGVQVDLTTPLRKTRQAIRRLQRHIERQRWANNPGNYLPDGRIRPGPKRWRVSGRQRQAQAKLAELHRRAAAHRKSLHGQLVNSLFKVGHIIRIEKNSYRSFQRNFGRSVGSAAPAGFVRLLERKAENAGVRVDVLPARLRLSQVCHGCGGIEKKPLAQRVHACACGVGPVQRDVYSAWLACWAIPASEGAVWRLDADQARAAWTGAESRLPAASSPIGIQAFAAWADQVARGSQPAARLPEGGTERLAGAVSARADEARDGVGGLHSLASSREPERVGRAATRTPRL